MPESVKDRPTRSHEHIFLLSKNARYFYNWHDARNETARYDAPPFGGNKAQFVYNGHSIHSGNVGNPQGLSNWRDVWQIGSEGFCEAHFAVMPQEIVKRCIIAGCPPMGAVLDPFAGSGTTLKVAIEMGRKAIGIELNPKYAEMIKERTRTQIGLAI
jgi:DNA modification methylase